MKVWMALGLAPASIKSEANVWRHSCSVIGASSSGSLPSVASSPARALKAFHAALARLSTVEETNASCGCPAEDKLLTTSLAALNGRLQAAPQDCEHRHRAPSRSGLGFNRTLLLIPAARHGSDSS